MKIHVWKISYEKKWLPNVYLFFICSSQSITLLNKKKITKFFTTNARFGNTRLSDNSLIRAILEFHHPHYLHHSAKVNAPAIRLLRLASVVTSKPKKT